jgi:hypothetical protein
MNRLFSRILEGMQGRKGERLAKAQNLKTMILEAKRR